MYGSQGRSVLGHGPQEWFSERFSGLVVGTDLRNGSRNDS